jgi:hypothetical protein
MPAKMFCGKTVMRWLRHKGSQEYFRDGAWTTDPDEASHFCDAVEAAKACARYGLTDVELALRFDAGSVDVFCTTIR